MLNEHTILYVEDDEATLSAFTNVFSDYFKAVFIAKDGEQGLRLFQQYHPDLILTDLQLPIMNGLDMIAAIRDTHPEIPIIINSAFSDTELLLRSIHLHVDNYILKPTDPAQLIHALQKASQILKLENALHASRETIQTIIDEIPDPILYIEKDYSVSMMNTAARQINNWKDSDDLPTCHAINYQRDLPCTDLIQPCPLEQVNLSLKPVTLRHIRRDSEGNNRHVNVHMRPIFDHEGKIAAYLEIAHDITDYLAIQEQLRQEAEKLSHLSLHDPLTHLPNRRLLSDRIDQAIQYKQRTGDQFAVLFLDLDHFKEVNDSMGHLSGDQLLIEASHRLQKIMRKGDTIARIGGDEFVLIIENGNDISHYSRVAEKILKMFTAPYRLNEADIIVGCSIGISIYPQHGDTAETLLANADAAMYESKRSGRSRYHFYQEEMTQNASQFIHLASDLKYALHNRGLELYFQPLLNISNQCSICAETLIRWNHPSEGFLSPGVFLPVAYKAGLMIELDWWVLRQIAMIYSRLRKIASRLEALSVNLTVNTLFAADFIALFDHLLESFNIPGNFLTIEIVESQLMENVSLAKQRIDELQARGIRVAIDDFGTGFSSLSYLLEFDVDILKIDQSFVESIQTFEKSEKLIHTILALCKTLNIRSVAEGVETEAQKQFLIDNGVDVIQGYHYARPMDQETFIQFMS